MKIDFLPISWQPALARVGKGGSGEIRQSQISLQISFAFKVLHVKYPEDTRRLSNQEIFRALMAEVSVLGHSLIRGHPNIITIQGICWHIDPETDQVWPVLVFEKSQYGHLGVFMRSADGQIMSLESKINICASIAMAISDMHSASKKIIPADDRKAANL
jgi:hypothetical protein